ncbi:hypothetical protein FSP39_006785 [Pinctada imbricata]|uniref:Uncharacterized protein n=1 Tax=Pinctada imbricata TaxID=66713 RepID=A0AA89BN26_PINIB|nr:hypothetical protein FSP39_006785 [Pinctada imbricata]
MKEKVYEQKVEAFEKEKRELCDKIQKSENREKETKIQMEKIRDKNTKLSSECENLRQHIATRKDAESELRAKLKEKEVIIADLTEKGKQIAGEIRSNPPESTIKGIPSNVSGETEEIVRSSVSVSNRFERPAQKTANGSQRKVKQDAVYVKGYREPLSNSFRMKFRWEN